MPLPNFLIIGAPKCATTSLHFYLGQHPEIFMSPVKEPRYFARPKQVLGILPFAATLAEYEAMFAGAGAAKAIGEASPQYLADPRSPLAIHELIPRARLIAILRQPIDRAYSGFLMHRRLGREPRESFEEALRHDDGEPDGAYLNPSRYARHLERYLALFPREQMLLLIQEEVSAATGAALAECCRFLAVDAAFAFDTAVRHNLTRVPISAWLNRALVGNARRAKPPLRRLLPRGWGDRLYNRLIDLNLTTERVPPLDRALRSRLTAEFEPEIAAVERLLGRGLALWRQ